MRTASFIVVLMLVVVAVGCSRGASSSGSAQNAPALRRLPVELRVEQRSTTRVPGSQGKLRLSVDDVTGGQVMTSLVDGDGSAVMTPTSMKPGGSEKFKLGDQTYRLELEELSNAVIGKDFAQFVISENRADDAQGSKRDESERIEQLLARVAAATDAKFIRNGKEYGSQEAADHMCAKWQAAGSEIASAEEFIEKIASKSSMTGEPYHIRTADGKQVLSGDYLREQLKLLDGQERVAQ